ncbi:MAG: phosphatase PAP2 family protein [Candidatus Brocadiae bacterium]|nr:phosphatase PAP2 family protein [Candidatus Brocadiia bacterium]
MTTQRFKILFSAFFLLWISLFAAFGKWDLNISQSLYNPDIAFVKAIENYGEIPGLVFCFFALILMNSSLQIKNNLLRGMAFLVNLLLGFIVLCYIYLIILYNHYGRKNFDFLANIGILLWIVPGLILLLAMFSCKQYGKQFALQRKAFSSVAVWLSLSGFIVVQTLKSIWGRTRFRDLAQGYTDFSPWYFPQQAHGDSFPSGHTLFAWVLLPLFLLCLDKKSFMRFFLLLLSIVWGLTVGMSRIVIGAHYASDVLFSAGFCVLAFLLLYKRHYVRFA